MTQASPKDLFAVCMLPIHSAVEKIKNSLTQLLSKRLWVQ